MCILLTKKQQLLIQEEITGIQLKHHLNEQLNLNGNEYYLISNGNLVKDDSFVNNGIVHIVPRVFGGKGGFGSMLRAIGAQIEKTTNREACRDLSGRRLRDINEEQRLKNWINQQAEREKEAKERKKKKLERLCEKPKHEFKDEEYDKERSELPEIVEDALLQGLQASSSTVKRKSEDTKPVIKSKKKKTKLWVDEELEDSLSSSDSDSESKTSHNKASKEESSSNSSEEQVTQESKTKDDMNITELQENTSTTVKGDTKDMMT
ncbi:unnamed protein product [Callosobruchus maculatus]|uniref:SDE2-like domain-containing protein n=1 Tax=Callosobruchus maculatus TaxID=64391 RepID=A0A653C2Z7_CALMS|nr:unnamed protein product [Callosobruchus maculatus]